MATRKLTDYEIDLALKEAASRGWLIFPPEDSVTACLGYVPTQNTENLRRLMRERFPDGVGAGYLRKVAADGATHGHNYAVPFGSFHAAWERMKGSDCLRPGKTPETWIFKYEPDW